MILRYILLLACLVTYFAASAFTLRGSVTDSNGEAIPYAAVYFEELQYGISVDDEGRFGLELPDGTYHCKVSSIGFKSLETLVSSDKSEYNFVLEMRPISLAEVEVTADGSEDPAYRLMRQVIARAPFYECVPDSFAARAYVKGTGKITDVPAVFDLSADFRKEKDELVNRLFVLEKVSEITYSAPNKWTEHVEAESNTFPAEVPAIPVTIVNFYEKKLFGSPSPLRQGAFTYYKYKLEDSYEEGEHTIYKIKVIPRRKEKNLLSGHLYVVDNAWCLSALDVTVQGSVYDAHVVSTFQEVKDETFLPVSQAITCNIGALGVKLKASYTLSAQYSYIGASPGEVLRNEVSSLTNRGKKLLDEIAQIEQNGKLETKEDAYRLSSLTAKLMEENMLAQGKIKRRSKYDLTYQIGAHSSTADSVAVRRDSAYWAAARVVPLSDEELESYRYLHEDTAKADEDDGAIDALIETVMHGKRFYTPNKRGWLRFNGLKSFLAGSNCIDGFRVGLGVKMRYQLGDKLAMRMSPSVYYCTARKAVVGRIDASLYYLPIRNACVLFSGGRETQDFNLETPESAAVVTLATALFGRNDVKFYDRTFVSVGHDIEIANGMRLRVDGKWERRRPHDLHVHHSWFKKEVKPNIPENDQYVAMPPINDALTASASITYTPESYYYIVHGGKRYLESRFPTIKLTYTRGIGFNDYAPEYNRIELGVEQELELGIFNKIIYQARGGIYFGASKLQFADFKHFSATRFPLTARAFSDSFLLLDNYAYSTDSRYAEAGFTWQSPRLLLKQLPFLRNKNFSECLHLRSLVTHHRRPYSELGYSINLFDIFSVGVFTSWKGVEYNSVGVSVMLPIDEL